MKRLMTIFVMIVVLTMLLSAADGAGLSGLETLLPLASKPKVKIPVTITWLGHSAFKLESGGKTIFIDPWISGNPQCPIKVGDIKVADLILVTHDHY